MIRLAATLAAIAIPALLTAGFPARETRGRVTIIHVVPDAGDEDDAYVSKVLKEAPAHAGVAHVFLRPGGDEAAWGAAFKVPEGIAYFASPQDYTASPLDPTVPAVLALDRDGKPDVRPIVQGPQTYRNIPRWQTLLQQPNPPSDIDSANAKPGVPALGGYDPTTYLTGRPGKGDPSITTEYNGITYSFGTFPNRHKFLLDPEKYVPAYGGWCAWAMVDGEKVDVDPETYKIVDGRILLFYNGFLGNTLKKWNKGDEGTLKRKADAQWNALKGRKPE